MNVMNLLMMLTMMAILLRKLHEKVKERYALLG
jgi:hypothetical protein